jgi:hypothetical protein
MAPLTETQSGWWWFSFADPTRPDGTQFLGVCIVYGPDFETALARSHALRVNPGGEVRALGIIEGRVPSVPWRHRLLTKGEALELMAWAEERFGGKA